MILSRALVFLIFSAPAIALAQTAPPDNSLPARAELNLGVDAYKAARYDEAIAHFRKAAELDPALSVAKVYLATALAQNVVPGLDTPENLKTAGESIAIFKDILDSKAGDLNAMKQVAGIYFSLKKLDDARTWQKKILDEDPTDSEAAYTIGVIDWTQAHQNALKALQAAGLNDDGEGNLAAPPAVIETIRQKNAALVEEGLHYLSLAVQLRANYDDAMAYLNLVYRRKADLDRDDSEARQADIDAARQWAAKAMETRKHNQELRMANPGASTQQ